MGGKETMSSMPKIAIITGASRGIGAATARRLAAENYAVCINYKQNKQAADALVAEIAGKGGKAIAVQADIAREADIMKLFETVDREMGNVTALVNNAAMQARGGIDSLSWNDLQAMFAANIFGAALCCREAARRMKDSGAIVNVSSEAARFGGNKMLAYAASKGALNTLTFSLARDLAPKIRVNAVSPGVIDTEAQRSAPPEVLEKRVASVPAGRMGTAEEVAAAIAWLLSDAASYVTGTIVPITGGR